MTRSADRARARALFGPPETTGAGSDPVVEIAAPADEGGADTGADTPPDADARVVALLRDAVPPVPDAPDRLAAVRARAGHQRSTVWSQILGAAAAVLLVAGVAAAIGAPKPGEIRPSSRPFAHLAERLARQTSVSFELTTRRLTNQAGMPQGAAATAVASGAYARNGDLRLDGNLGILALSVGETGNLRMRSVGGVTYRGVMPFEHAPAGKQWVREDVERADVTSGADIERLVDKAVTYARNVHYVRQGVVRDTKVAEYVVTVPAQYLGGDDLSVTVALDAQGLPRRLSADISLRQLVAIETQGDDEYESGSDLSPSGLPDYVVHAELDLFDYGRPVDVTAPPASEVITAVELRQLEVKRMAQAQHDYQACIRKAHEAKDMRACDKILGQSFGFGTDVPPMSPQDCTTETRPDGSQQMVCRQSSVLTSGTRPGTSGSGSGGVGSGWVMTPAQPGTSPPAP
jgi:hypothetical protein